MSYDVLRNATPIARKSYECDACLHLRTQMDEAKTLKGVSFTERRAIVKARKNNWRIQKGEKYMKQVGVFDGDLSTFRAIPEIHQICYKYEFYPYD